MSAMSTDVNLDLQSIEELKTNLQACEERFHLLVESVKEYAILMLDPNGIITSWNEGVRRIKGYERDEILGQHFSKFYPKEAIEAGHPERELKIAAREGSYKEEGLRVRKDGSLFHANVLITALRNKTGRLVGFSKVTRDVTDQKRAEEEIRQSEEKYRLAVESVKEYAIFCLDPQGQVISWNEGARRIKGYEKNEILGLHFSKFYTKDAIEAGQPERELKIAALEGYYKEEAMRVRKDGTLFHASVLITALRDRAGKLIGFSKVTRDITDLKDNESRKKYEAELKSKLEVILDLNNKLGTACQTAKDASTAKSDFLTTISHEIRTPLNGIIGMSTLLQDTELKPEQKEYVDTIENSGKILLALINDILDFSKIEAGKVVLEELEFDLCHYFRELFKPFYFTTKRKGISFTFESSDYLYCVLGDQGRIGQILLNLISNAIKFTKAGGVTVHVDLVTKGDYTSVVITVKDTGIGIPTESNKEIFEAFSQAEKSTTRQFGGTGLGLSISKRLVELMRGNIGFVSEYGKGTTFKVEMILETGKRIQNKIRTKILNENIKFLGRILVAEDNPANQLLIDRVLAKWECKCLVVANGFEVLDALKNYKFDLILMDCQMPEMDGYTASQIIRKSESPYNTIPIVALTANAFTEGKVKCLTSGMNDCISKPIDWQLLKTTLKKYLLTQPKS